MARFGRRFPIPRRIWYRIKQAVAGGAGEIKTSAGVAKPVKIFPSGVTKPMKALTGSGWILIGGGGGGSFDPLSIGWQGAWWVSAQSSPGDGNPIGTMEDSTSNNNDLTTIAGGTNRPTYRSSPTGFNGQPAAEFVAANTQYWASGTGIWTGTADDQPFDICLVMKQAAINAGTYKSFAGYRTGSQVECLTNLDADWWGVAGVGSLSGGTPDTNTHALIFRFNGASSQIIQDGTVILTADAGTNAMADLIVGCRYNGTIPWGGHIAWVSKKQGTLLTTQELSDWFDWCRDYYGTP